MITGASHSTPIVIFSPRHGLQSGDKVVIGGVVGNTAANGTFVVEVSSDDQFVLRDSEGNGDYVRGGSWTRAGGTIDDAFGVLNDPVMIDSPNHGLYDGDQVYIEGLTGHYTSLNGGSFYVTVIDDHTFALNGTRADGGTGFGGTWTPSDKVLLKGGLGGMMGKDGSGLNFQDSSVTDFAFERFVLNSADPRRILLGYHGLYEDSNTDPAEGYAGDVIGEIDGNLPGWNPHAMTVSALAYGGWHLTTPGVGSGSVKVPDVNVAVVGTSSGHLYYRGASGDTFTEVIFGHDTPGAIQSITLDPDDWRHVAVVEGNRVWTTDDITDPGVPFTCIGGGSDDNLGSLTSQLRAITFIDGTPGVGGLGGVFHLVPDANGPGQYEWEVFGAGLPHTVVHDLHWNETTDFLIAATFGRGAWTVQHASGQPYWGYIWAPDLKSNEDWTVRAFQELLGRPPDAETKAAWIRLLDQGASRAQLVKEILDIAEYHALEVRRSYRQLLRRSPSPGEKRRALAALAHGHSVDQLRALLLASTDYFRGRAGGNNARYLRALARDVMGHPLGRPTSRTYSRMLARGTPRAAVVKRLLGVCPSFPPLAAQGVTDL